MTDPISDMLIRIKNAGAAGKQTVVIPYSKFKFSIANALLREGYIVGVNRKGRGVKRQLEVGLGYDEKKPKIKGIERVSKLSKRIYFGVRDLKPVRQGYGHILLSTPKGVMTGKQAKKEKIGGEALFKVW